MLHPVSEVPSGVQAVAQKDMHALGQISDQEMKLLVTEVVDRSYDFLMELCSPQGAELLEDLKQRDVVPKWNDPEPMIFRHL